MQRHRKSTIDRLPTELREMIAERQEDGAMIDEIVAELHARGAKVSRSAVGRYIQRLAAVDKMGVGHELRALRQEVADLKAVLRAEIGRVGAEVQELKETIEAWMAVIRERSGGDAAL